jgi:hypothetical protein
MELPPPKDLAEQVKASGDGHLGSSNRLAALSRTPYAVLDSLLKNALATLRLLQQEILSFSRMSQFRRRFGRTDDGRYRATRKNALTSRPPGKCPRNELPSRIARRCTR